MRKWFDEQRRRFDTSRFLALAALVVVSCAAHESTKEPLERGWVERRTIQGYAWFDSEYNAYIPSADMLEDVNVKLEGVEFLIVVGSWCSNTRRVIPRFFKIADVLHIPHDRVRLYRLDRSRQYPEEIPQKHAITELPAIIVKRGDRVLGRIVEAPSLTLEMNLLGIILR